MVSFIYFILLIKRVVEETRLWLFFKQHIQGTFSLDDEITLVKICATFATPAKRSRSLYDKIDARVFLI